MRTFQDGDPVFGVMMNAIANLWPNGTAVLSGCTPTGSGAARQITVAAGTVVIGGTVRSVSQQTKTLDAATFDRYDLLSVNSSGTVIVTTGTEERRVPALPANSVPIAICLIETGQTTLPADRIYDTRMDALRLSVLNIDADKDWNGKSITNVNQFQAASANLAEITTSRYTLLPDISLVPGSALCYADNTEVSRSAPSPHIVKTAPPVPAGRYGTVTVCYNLRTSTTLYPSVIYIYKNGVSVYSTHTDSTSYANYATNVDVASGDVLALAVYSGTSATAWNSRFEIHAITVPGIVNSITW